MGTAKIPPTIEQHREIAKKIRIADTFCRELLNPLAGHYGMNSRELSLLQGLREKLGAFKCAMDSNAIKENPGVPLKELTFYYNEHAGR